MASLAAQIVKNLPATQETRVQSLGREDLLEKLPTPVFLPGEIPWIEEPGGQQPMRSRLTLSHCNICNILKNFLKEHLCNPH